MIYLFFLFCISLGGFYLLLFMTLGKGWDGTPEFDSSPQPEATPLFSILIPARNEEKNIGNCLNDLIAQNYPAGSFELIVIDDGSEDRTPEITRDLTRKFGNVRYLRLEDSLSVKAHKKRALEAGIQAARFPWIITTDADCRRGKNWLKTIAAFIACHTDARLISAPVAYQYDSKFGSKAQALEFAGLIGIGAACITRQKPNLCNGANLIYRKDAFYEVGGFSNINNLASGDDEFLMHKMHHHFHGKIHFLKSREAVVSTAPAPGLSEFLMQRKRWVSKSRKYQRKGITLTLIAAYVLNSVLLISFITSLYDIRFLWLGLLVLILKLFAEWRFLKKVTGWFGQPDLMKTFLPAALLHVPYVLFIGIYGNFGGYRWKGRKLR